LSPLNTEVDSKKLQSNGNFDTLLDGCTGTTTTPSLATEYRPKGLRLRIDDILPNGNHEQSCASSALPPPSIIAIVSVPQTCPLVADTQTGAVSVGVGPQRDLLNDHRCDSDCGALKRTCDSVACFGIPDAECPVVRPRDDALPVRREPRCDAVCVALERTCDSLACFGIPDADPPNVSVQNETQIVKVSGCPQIERVSLPR